MSQSVEQQVLSLAQQAQQASRVLAFASTKQKNQALISIEQQLRQHQSKIITANQQDVASAKEKNLEAALIDRLELTEARFEAMLQGLRDVVGLADPIGEITDMAYRPSGIQLGKMRVPLGVVAMIYESRPNVTIEAASLAIKSGNAIILRGGSESLRSNQALAIAIQAGLAEAKLPQAAVQVVQTADREAVGQLITLSDYIDVIVPRGGKGLIERISKDARIPVIKHLDGNCHVFVDQAADLSKAVDISINAKTHRYGVCNAMETLLVDESVAAEFLAKVVPLYQQKQVELRGCEKTREILNDQPIVAATEDDWWTEYLAPVLAIKVVAGLDQAIEHINHYGSHHTDVIVSENYSTARQFIARVDSSSVMINASSRFADGFEYGFGAEIGISTDKIHARGPVGMEGLTSQKWVVFGDGHIRQ